MAIWSGLGVGRPHERGTIAGGLARARCSGLSETSSMGPCLNADLHFVVIEVKGQEFICRCIEPCLGKALLNLYAYYEKDSIPRSKAAPCFDLVLAESIGYLYPYIQCLLNHCCWLVPSKNKFCRVTTKLDSQACLFSQMRLVVKKLSL